MLTGVWVWLLVGLAFAVGAGGEKTTDDEWLVKVYHEGVNEELKELVTEVMLEKGVLAHKDEPNTIFAFKLIHSPGTEKDFTFHVISKFQNYPC